MVPLSIKQKSKLSRPSQGSCTDCSLSGICWPVSDQNQKIILTKLDGIIYRRRSFEKGETIYRSGVAFTSFYIVRTGMVKTYSNLVEGDKQVTGFYLPGDIFGIDGMSNNRHSNDAMSLESSSICEVSFSRLERLLLEFPSLQRHLFRMLSKEIISDQQRMMLLCKKNAGERVLSLILSISAKHERRGSSPLRFRLPMSRVDIGDYLGLADETVSRAFSALQKQGVIFVDGKEVEVIDSALVGSKTATTFF